MSKVHRLRTSAGVFTFDLWRYKFTKKLKLLLYYFLIVFIINNPNEGQTQEIILRCKARHYILLSADPLPVMFCLYVERPVLERGIRKC